MLMSETLYSVIVNGLTCTELLYLQLGWSTETFTLLASDELAKDVHGAEEMMERHHELKTEINNRDEK